MSISPVTAHARIGRELRAVENLAMREGLVLDRDTVTRLARPLGLVAALHDLHEVDDLGRCGTCRRRWPRGRPCSLWPLITAHYAAHLSTAPLDHPSW